MSGISSSETTRRTRVMHHSSPAQTLRVWDTLEKDYLSVERARRVYDVDTETPADIDAFPPATSARTTM